MNVSAILEARRRLLGPNLGLHYRRPLHIVRGRMQFLYDADGTAYLDAVNNVAHVGHQHPSVVEAIRRQAGILNTNTRYLHEGIVSYAEGLVATLPDRLEVCWFVNSGSEANELALRIARTATGRTDVLVLEGAYHGNTSSLVAMSPYKYRAPGGPGPSPWVHEAPLPASGHAGPPAAGVAAALEAAAAGGRAVAAFFVEPIPGCAGHVVPPSDYLSAAFREARRAGAVCVADEVQTGFGRVGEPWWAFRAVSSDAVPDIVTLGKPMGNGHPVGAVVTTRDLADRFARGVEYFSSFGGNPVSIAAAAAVLAAIREEGLAGRAGEVGDHLRRGLGEVARRHPAVGEVRGRGLYLGVELIDAEAGGSPAPALAVEAAEALRESRILVGTDGIHGNVLKIKPPLPFTQGDADRLVEELDRVLAGADPSSS